MSVEFDRGSPGKFDSRTLSRETLSRWNGRSITPSVPTPSAPLRAPAAAEAGAAVDPAIYIYIYI